MGIKTEEDLNAYVEKHGVLVRAEDAKPYRYLLPCIVGDTPMLNEMTCRRRRDDGRICWLLDTHNTFSARPEDMLRLIPVGEGEYSEEFYRRVDADDAHMMKQG